MSNGDSVRRHNQEIRNPGLVMNLNDKYTSVLPVLFDGLRVNIHRSLSSHFKVIHNIYFSSITPGNYRFGAAYVGTKAISNHHNGPVLFGDMATNGNLNATMYHVFGSRFKVKFDAQMENGSFVNSQLASHYLGNSCTASVIVANSDILSKSGGLFLQFLQSVTPSVALGVEFAYLRNMSAFNKTTPPFVMENSESSQLALMGRYSAPHSTWSTVVSLNNLLVDCYKQASEQIDFGIEIDTNFRTFEAVGTLAFKLRLVGRGIVFKGMIDTNTNVGSVIEKRFCNSPIALSVSTNLNHRTSDFRLGLGIIVEG